MAYPTPVNSQITDAVTQQNMMVLSSASSMAMGSIYQSAAHSIAIAFENAVQAQRQAAICAQASTNQGVIQVYALGSATAAAATTRVARPDPLRNALMFLVAAKTLNLI